MPLPSDRSPRVGRARLLPTLIEGLVLAYAVGAALHLVHSGQHEAHEVAPALHWLRDSSLAVPGAIATVWLVARLAGRIVAWAGVPQRSTVGRAVAGGARERCNKRAYREFVADFQDGLNLRDKDGARIPEADEVDDPFEQGNRGVNYRTERFAPRLAANSEPAWVMSSKVHGDPATPVFEAYAGDPVRFRLLMGGDRGRAHSFLMHGHGWPNQPTDPASMTRTNRGGVMAGNAYVFDVVGGAGGLQKSSGDYLFRDGNLVNQVNAGLWGLLRAHGAPQPGLKPLG